MKTDFVETEAYARIHNFILLVDDSIKHSEQRTSPEHERVLDNIQRMVETTEKSTAPQRYANEAARTVFLRISEAYSNEYLANAFGNAVRLDYGTGHELNYLCYLYTEHCERRLDICCVFRTLERYFEVVRLFVTKFRLEPAGSHGAWGLDDYQFLPFLFGSSELFGMDLRFEELEGDRCYVVAVQRKLGGNTHTLQNIMDKGWSVVNRGIIRMYDNHVLRRSVVTQHFIYGRHLDACRAEQS